MKVKVFKNIENPNLTNRPLQLTRFCLVDQNPAEWELWFEEDFDLSQDRVGLSYGDMVRITALTSQDHYDKLHNWNIDFMKAGEGRRDPEVGMKPETEAGVETLRSLKEWQVEAHQGAQARGFYDHELGERTPTRIASLIALIHSELSEALEEIRQSEEYELIRYEGEKPYGVPIELADTVIRILDLAEWLDIDLEQAIELKVEYNKTRPHRHGDKLL